MYINQFILKHHFPPISHHPLTINSKDYSYPANYLSSCLVLVSVEYFSCKGKNTFAG